MFQTSICIGRGISIRRGSDRVSTKGSELQVHNLLLPPLPALNLPCDDDYFNGLRRNPACQVIHDTSPGILDICGHNIGEDNHKGSEE